MDSFYQSAIVHLTAAIDNKNTDNGSEVNAQFLQAETQIQRGLTASKKFTGLHVERAEFQLYDLQLLLYSHKGQKQASLTLLKKLLADTSSFDQDIKSKDSRQMLWNWHVHFLSRKLELFSQDWDAYLSVSKEAVATCTKNVHMLQAASFLLLRAQNAMLHYKLGVVESILARVSDILTSAATSISEHGSKNTYFLVKRFYLILNIMHLIGLGKVNEALPILTTLHALLDTDQSFADQDELTIMADDTQLIATDNRPLNLPHMTWKQKKLPYLLSYLLSGVVHKSQDTAKAILFLTEGLNAITAETLLCDESDHPQKSNHLVELQLHIMLQLSETYMNSYQLVLAAQTLKDVTKKALDHLELFYILEPRIQFDWACLYHSLGQIEQAYEIFMNLSTVAVEERTTSVDPALVWMARVNAYLIDLSREKMDHDGLLWIKQNAFPDSVYQSIVSCLLNASTNMTKSSYKSSKQELLNAFKMTTLTQDALLSAISLGMVGDLFWDTNHRQAVSMTGKSLALARKAHCLPIVVQALEKLGVSQAMMLEGDGQQQQGSEDYAGEAARERGLLDAEVSAALLILDEVRR